MINVLLLGRFKSFHDGPIKIEAKNAFEAVETISRQLEGFAPNPKTGKARVKVVGYETQEALHADLEDGSTIRIVPQLNGGKSSNGAFMQIIAGVALIGVSFIPGIGAFAASIAAKVGTMLLLGGLSQLLAPAPENDKDGPNRYLGAPGNTTKIGTRIPILYGKDRVSGHFLSFDINSQQFSGAAKAPSEGK